MSQSPAPERPAGPPSSRPETSVLPPCVLFEDEHLLVVNKPAGWNTHAPAPHAGEGIYDWLRHREPRWAELAILHRLDKETSGVLVFGKTPQANKSLADQFEQRRVVKRYLLVSDRSAPSSDLVVRSNIARDGERYQSVATGGAGEPAETRFKLGARNPADGTWEIQAEPHTGRTHQIRVHASVNAFPILGDTLYGGTPATRVFLHAQELIITHPASGEPMTFRAPADFQADTRLALRWAVVDVHGSPAELTNAFRLIHGAADGWPGWQVERLGDFLLSQSEAALTAAQSDQLATWLKQLALRGAYHKRLDRRVRQSKTEQASPQLVLGEAAPERFTVRENGLAFELSFNEGYSYGLFLDQRDNRRLLASLAAGRRVLNCFCYTGGFSLAALRAGAAEAWSIDSSADALEVARTQQSLNQIESPAHWIQADVFDALKQFASERRQFDLIVLDPPKFAPSVQHLDRATRAYKQLSLAALRLLAPGGRLFTFSCSGAVSVDLFQKVVAGAVIDARVDAQMLARLAAGEDHPVSMTHPEGEYLKGLMLGRL